MVNPYIPPEPKSLGAAATAHSQKCQVTCKWNYVSLVNQNWTLRVKMVTILLRVLGDKTHGVR